MSAKSQQGLTPAPWLPQPRAASVRCLHLILQVHRNTSALQHVVHRALNGAGRGGGAGGARHGLRRNSVHLLQLCESKDPIVPLA
jgi:hypothetical protein